MGPADSLFGGGSAERSFTLFLINVIARAIEMCGGVGLALMTETVLNEERPLSNVGIRSLRGIGRFASRASGRGETMTGATAFATVIDVPVSLASMIGDR